MAPGTPSPHRFLAGGCRQPSPSKNAKPNPSRLRQQIASESGDGFEQVKLKTKTPALRHEDASERGDGFEHTTPRAKAPAARQFAQTPRFSVGRPASTPQPQREATTASPSIAQVLRASIAGREDVEETEHKDDQNDEMLDDEQSTALPTIEIPDSETWSDNLPHSPKRRKLEDQQRSKPVFKLPTTPASAQFIGASSVATDDSATSIRRPAFLRSSVAPSEQFEPTPEAFSPHRRGEKFVPGGMAATLQQWVVETGQAAAHSRKGQGYLREEEYVLRFKVQSVHGSGPMFIEGLRQDGSSLHVMLIVDAKRSSNNAVSAGVIVGVRAPTWEIEIEGVEWTVAVDWRLQ